MASPQASTMSSQSSFHLPGMRSCSFFTTRVLLYIPKLQSAVGARDWISPALETLTILNSYRHNPNFPCPSSWL